MQLTNELSNDSKIVWDSEEIIEPKEIKKIIENYMMSSEFKLLQKYDDYYESENTFIMEKVYDKRRRDKTPNNAVPTSYYSTLVDTMAGFMFANVQYNARMETDEEYAAIFNELLKKNQKEVKEMKTGTYALAYNKGIELVYTVGDENGFNIKYTDIDPRQAIVVYDNKIEPDIFCLIWIRLKEKDKQDYLVDVIYKNLWQYYEIVNDEINMRDADRFLEFPECPVIVYNTNNMSIRSPFHKVIKYINALDYLVTGNANDMEALTDAILVLTQTLKDEDLKHLDELKAIMDVDKDDRVEFLTKQMDPAFREYVSKLLIREIHKHSHVVDYFSPDAAMGEVSGKALRIRLFDMDAYSQKIEKIYRLGTEKKVRLLGYLLNLKENIQGEIDIVFNRTVPDDFEELAPVLNQLTFISDKTKIERLGLDVENESERMEEQKTANMERMSLMMPEDNEDNEDTENDEEIEEA